MCDDDHLTIQKRYQDYKDDFEKDVLIKNLETFKEYFHYNDKEAQEIIGEYNLLFLDILK